jgi:hypothetical protein
LCAAICAAEAVVYELLSVARYQRMRAPTGALRRMLLSVACLGHVQQRPGSDLPQLREGVVQWLAAAGLSAVEASRQNCTWSGRTKVLIALVIC